MKGVVDPLNGWHFNAFGYLNSWQRMCYHLWGEYNVLCWSSVLLLSISLAVWGRCTTAVLSTSSQCRVWHVQSNIKHTPSELCTHPQSRVSYHAWWDRLLVSSTEAQHSIKRKHHTQQHPLRCSLPKPDIMQLIPPSNIIFFYPKHGECKLL